MIVIMHWCANLHDPRHKYVVLKGVGIALRIFVELIQDVGAFPVHILPLFHWLRHHLHTAYLTGCCLSPLLRRKV